MSDEATLAPTRRVSVESKRCTRCGEIKPAGEFYASPNAATGLASWCKPCFRAGERERVAARGPQAVAVASKRCSLCNMIKSAREFVLDPRRLDGLGSWCRACNSARNRAGRRSVEPRARSTEPKRCVKCGEIKPASEFHTSKTSSDGLKSWCKPCHNAGTVEANRRLQRERRELAGRAARFGPLADRWADHLLIGDGCWEWQGWRSELGYGRVWGDVDDGGGRRMLAAHRAAYELHVGPIPDGYQIHHKCENPSCVRPGHLEALTPLEHSRRHPKAPGGSR